MYNCKGLLGRNVNRLTAAERFFMNSRPPGGLFDHQRPLRVANTNTGAAGSHVADTLPRPVSCLILTREFTAHIASGATPESDEIYMESMTLHILRLGDQISLVRVFGAEHGILPSWSEGNSQRQLLLVQRKLCFAVRMVVAAQITRCQCISINANLEIIINVVKQVEPYIQIDVTCDQRMGN
jgi:hypothetical protein